MSLPKLTINFIIGFMMSMLSKVDELIESSHDEVLMCKKWNIFYRDNLYKEVYGRIWPSTHRYYFEANPSFLTEYKNFADMQRFPIIMLRDGLITLSAFFLSNPKPPADLESILLIAKRWEHIVPKPWHKNVALYSFSRPEVAKKPKNVLGFGIFNEYSFWKNTPEECFLRVKKLIPADSKKVFYMPMRERSVFQSVDESPVYTNSLKLLFEHFGSDFELITNNNKILSTKLEAGDAILNITPDNLLCSDNYLNHFFSSKNIGELGLEETQSVSSGRKYALSLYHDVCISEINSEGEAFASMFYKMKILNVKPSELNPKFHIFLKELVKKGNLEI